MSRTVLLATLSLFLAGCAAGSGGAGDGSTDTSRATLTVLNYLDTHQPDSAYLAKFEIVSGSAAILSPTRERDIEMTGPGTHRLPGIIPSFVKAQRDLYSPRATGLLNEAPAGIVNVTILVVTSDQPLNLAPYLASSRGLRDQLLNANANNEQLIVAEIMKTVVQNPASVRWDSDIRSVRIPPSWAGG